MKKKIKHSILSVIGFILSPLSWWNDLFINIPLAYGFASLFGFISKELFLPAMIVGYWITNVVGFILLHYGVKGLALKKEKKYTQKDLFKAFLISLFYTALVVAFVHLGILKLPLDYFV